MSDWKEDLPRDLRGLLGGREEESNGSYRVLFDPIKSYANLWEVCKEIERKIAEPDVQVDDISELRDELDSDKKRLVELKQRILEHFAPHTGNSTTENKELQLPKVDHGAKAKVEKMLANVEAGRYEHSRKSKALQAVLKAFSFFLENGRMPSHGELKELGFNDQQATDAGKWLEMQADPAPDENSLFLPLHRPPRGRPLKK